VASVLTPEQGRFESFTGLVRTRRRRRRVSLSLVVGATLFGTMLVVAIFATLISPHDPYAIDLNHLLARPGSPGHLLGTDSLGRDLLSRIMYGARTSLLVSGLGMLGSMLVGVTAGLMAAFGGRIVELLVLRLIDVQLAFPYVLLAIAITTVVRPSVPVLIMLMVLAGWAGFARVVRSAALQEAAKDYVKAAALVGATRTRIARKYVFPNLLPPILVLCAMQMAAMVVFEATLSFLGMGIQPPTPSWGGIMLESKTYLEQAWWVATLPGVAILVTTVSLNLLADGLQTMFGARVRDA